MIHIFASHNERLSRISLVCVHAKTRILWVTNYSTLSPSHNHDGLKATVRSREMCVQKSIMEHRKMTGPCYFLRLNLYHDDHARVNDALSRRSVKTRPDVLASSCSCSVGHGSIMMVSVAVPSARDARCNGVSCLVQ